MTAEIDYLADRIYDILVKTIHDPDEWLDRGINDATEKIMKLLHDELD